MPNPSGPDRDDTSETARFDSDALTRDDVTDPVESGVDAEKHTSEGDDALTESYPVASAESEAATQAIASNDQEDERESALPQRISRGERRFTAPGFDAKETAVIQTAADPATEVFRTNQPPRPKEPTGGQPRTAMPQLIPPRIGGKLRPSNQRSWGWVLALI
jgi:hypothetical protein